jgi:hypothetical protein
MHPTALRGWIRPNEAAALTATREALMTLRKESAQTGRASEILRAGP